MTDIVERLKKIFLPSDYFKELCEVRNAVAEIERLREENEKLYLENCHLRAVLSPFASEELLGWIKEANEAVYVESGNEN